MKNIRLIFIAATIVAQNTTQAQSTLTITFDGGPLPGPGSGQRVWFTSDYYESGMWFRPPYGQSVFGHVGADYSSDYPYNGTPYLQDTDGGVNCSANGSLFGVYSIDVAGYSTELANFDIIFYAARSDGTQLTTSFSGNGLDFQTYHFDPEWSSGLVAFGFGAPAWSVDNLVVSVPEPASGALLLVGVVTALVSCKRKSFG